MNEKRSSAEEIMQMLIKGNLVPQGFTGQIVFNVGQGCLFDVERIDKIRLMTRREDMPQKITLDKYLECANIGNNRA